MKTRMTQPNKIGAVKMSPIFTKLGTLNPSERRHQSEYRHATLNMQ